jgi:hypothetical protein
MKYPEKEESYHMEPDEIQGEYKLNTIDKNKDRLDLRIEAIRSRIIAVAKEQEEIAKELNEIERLQQIEEKSEPEIASQKYDNDVYKTIFDLEWGTMRWKVPKES